MRRTYLITTAILLATTLITTLAARAGEKPIQVFLLAGQSNMVGQGVGDELKPPYDKPHADVTIWNQRAKTWVPLTTGFGNKGQSFGPELSFGHAIKKAFPDDEIRLVKYAAGGTALYNDWAPTDGGQYVRFMETARGALAHLDEAGVKYEIAGMLWMQGESDAHERKAETYEKNLTDFIAHMRGQFKTPDMPFILGRVLSHYGGKTGQAKIVRDAQVKVAEAIDNVEWFDTDDCPVVDPKSNPGHYNTQGLLDIGDRFAEGCQEIAAEPAGANKNK